MRGTDSRHALADRRGERPVVNLQYSDRQAGAMEALEDQNGCLTDSPEAAPNRGRSVISTIGLFGSVRQEFEMIASDECGNWEYFCDVECR